MIERREFGEEDCHEQSRGIAAEYLSGFRPPLNSWQVFILAAAGCRVQRLSRFPQKLATEAEREDRVFIIWGTKTRREVLGAVADWCPACRDIQAFTITNYFRVGHIYYISLGRGSLSATVRECWECGSQYHGEEEDYDEFLPVESAEQLSLSALVRRTNLYLEEHLRSQRRARPDRGNRSPEVWDALPADDDATAP